MKYSTGLFNLVAMQGIEPRHYLLHYQNVTCVE